ncbi:ABC transporter ATP-binding protein [Haoranjiania flava]|uniref:ABC transporter ATP-binding protein n=1 Tax=Haoranjiania flava TaxID=1856322 RepID=A0AAE3LN90_9BACT|nr:ABC transporter ATP-binding protein [Haoranjiania flava]MCU7694721.1 ABC transporter ATP-binding protein [Haoranjiania flava]
MNDIIVHNITKTYEKGAVMAVDDVSFNVNEGELFGLIGPDGAGKTSIFRILTTLLLADTGTASVAGFDVIKDYKQIRSSIGYMPGRFSLYQDLTVQENLDFFANLFGTNQQQNYHLIKDIYEQIKPFSNRRAGKLSGGMKQKLALCCALVHKPRVLFLDEPTTGVDVVSRREFWEMLKKLKQQGITILVSTPYMDEATLCERIALIQKGKIMRVDTPRNILDTYPVKLYAAKAANIYSLLKDLRNHPDIESCYAFGEWLHITVTGNKDNGKQLIERIAIQKGHVSIVVKTMKPGIEDSFIRSMQNRQPPHTEVKEMHDEVL